MASGCGVSRTAYRECRGHTDNAHKATLFVAWLIFFNSGKSVGSINKFPKVVRKWAADGKVCGDHFFFLCSVNFVK